MKGKNDDSHNFKDSNSPCYKSNVKEKENTTNQKYVWANIQLTFELMMSSWIQKWCLIFVLHMSTDSEIVLLYIFSFSSYSFPLLSLVIETVNRIKENMKWTIWEIFVFIRYRSGVFLLFIFHFFFCPCIAEQNIKMITFLPFGTFQLLQIWSIFVFFLFLHFFMFCFQRNPFVDVTYYFQSALNARMRCKYVVQQWTMP